MLIALLASQVAHAQDDPFANYFEEFIPSQDGTQLLVQVWRPLGMPLEQQTPVVVNITPYAAGDPFPLWFDLEAAETFLGRGWTYVQGSPRGYASSQGCSDFWGPNDRLDPFAIASWAHDAPWSNGKLASYGVSANGTNALIALGSGAPIDAAVILAPVVKLYDLYYDGGVRYSGASRESAVVGVYASNQLGFHDASDAVQPCVAETLLDAFENDDPEHPFWVDRDLAPSPATDVPVLLGQGLNDSIVYPPHLTHLEPRLQGETHLVLPLYLHEWLRRADRFDDVTSFLAHHLEGGPPPRNPPVRVQDSDGRWRTEEAWPPADAQPHGFDLRAGAFTAGHGNSYANLDPTANLWTLTRPQPADAHLAGPGSLELSVTFGEGLLPPQAIASLYDVAPDGTATLITRAAVLLRTPATFEADLHATDWVLRAGHRLGLAISGTQEANFERARSPVDVLVLGGRLTVSLLAWTRDRFTDGGIPLGAVPPASTPLSGELIAANEVDVTLPPTGPHPCTADPGRTGCPAHLRGAREVPGEATVLLDTVVQTVNPIPGVPFNNTGVEFQIPEGANLRDVTVIATPESPESMSQVHTSISTTQEFTQPTELAYALSSDLWRSGVIWQQAAPGTYYAILWVRSGTETGQGGGAAPRIHVQVILRSEVDTDGDGVGDGDDNCPFVPNPDQADRGGVGTGGPDRIGDVCQCGDVNDDGLVNGNDASLIYFACINVGGLFPDRCSQSQASPLFVWEKCSVGADPAARPGLCNGNDATIVSRAGLGLDPGVRNVCPAYAPFIEP